MNDITTSLTQHSQEQVCICMCVCLNFTSGINFKFTKSACVLQRSRHLQRVVRRCAMTWKQRVLCKPQREHPKKSVTFFLTTPGSKAVPPSESVEREDEDEVLTKLWVWAADSLLNLRSTHGPIIRELFIFICRHLSRSPRRQPRPPPEVEVKSKHHVEIIVFFFCFLAPKISRPSQALKQLQNICSSVIMQCPLGALLRRNKMFFYLLLHSWPPRMKIR